MSYIARRRQRERLFSEVNIYLLGAALSVVLVINSVGHYMGVALGNIAFLLNILEVFTVLNRYAVICASVVMQLDNKIIKLKLTAPNIEHRARLTSQEGADGARLFNGRAVER